MPPKTWSCFRFRRLMSHSSQKALLTLLCDKVVYQRMKVSRKNKKMWFMWSSMILRQVTMILPIRKPEFGIWTIWEKQFKTLFKLD
jgi:hypothetical protein